jgi:hypothetical protein
MSNAGRSLMSQQIVDRQMSGGGYGSGGGGGGGGGGQKGYQVGQGWVGY